MLTGVEEFLIFGFMPLMIGIFAAHGAKDAPEGTVSGKVTIPHSPTLPAGAVVTVELVEQHHGETALPVLARETIKWRGAETQKFAIRFDPSLVRSSAFYALRASIIADGAVWFETQYPHLAAPLSGDRQILVLTSASGRRQADVRAR
jgi:putative lipoprotein